MPDFNSLFPSRPDSIGATPDRSRTERPSTASIRDIGAGPIGSYDDAALLKLWDEIRKECIDQRLIFERQWHRNLLYTLGRQWIEWHSMGGWKDKRMAQWMPRPVTNKCKETVQAIRAMFASIKLSVNVRPNGAEPQNIAAAATADELTPLIEERHRMTMVQNEFDFWLLVTGNAFLHTYLEYDIKNGVISDALSTCVGCGDQSLDSEIGQNDKDRKSVV